MLRATTIVLLSVALSACGTISGRTPIDATHRLEMKSVGAKAKSESLCLSANTIKALVSEILPEVQPSTCYRAVILSSDSSAISKAVGSYVQAERELLAQVAPPAANTASTGPASNVPAKVIIDATQTKSPDEFAEKFEALSGQLTLSEKSALESAVKRVNVNALDSVSRVNLKNAAKILEAK